MARDIAALVEQEIMRWRLSQRDLVPPAGKVVRPNVITAANAHGSCCEEIAREVGKALHIPVYDREIVWHIASDARVRIETVESLDQQSRGGYDEFVAAMFRERSFDSDDYQQGLVRTVLALWAHGPCVLVGHGAVHLVPRSHALAVRTTAPLAARVARLSTKLGIDVAAARRQVEQVDRERAAFHRRFFDTDVDNARNYDLALDTALIGVDGAAEVIVDLSRRRFNGRWFGEDAASTPTPC